MPLMAQALASLLPGASGMPFPPSATAAADQWVAAMLAYAGALVPLSSTAAAAAEVLRPALAASFSMMSSSALMDQAFAQYGIALAGGMAAAGFTGVPPAAPVGFADVFMLPPAATVDEGLLRVAMKIDLWMHTGIATMLAPPFTPQPWA